MFFSLNICRAAAPPTNSLRLAFSSTMFALINENDAKASIKAWGQALVNERHIPVATESAIFKNLSVLHEALRNKTVDAIGITTPEYAALCKDIPLSPIFITYSQGRTTEQYVLLVHQNSGIHRLADLRGRTLRVQVHPRNSLALPWLDTALAQKGLPVTSEFMGRLTMSTKLSNVVLPVFFRQCDACLTTRDGFDAMTILNPQVGKQLKVIAASPDVVPAVFCFRADYKSPFKNALLADIHDLNESVAGRQVLTVFGSERIEEQPASCLDSALKLLALHDRLCGSTNHLQAALPRSPDNQKSN